MVEEFFNSMRDRATIFDEQVKKLSETWRYPSNILGGYGADAKQAETHIKALRNDLSALKVNVAKDEEWSENYAKEIQRSTEEFKSMIQHLEHQCNDMRSVLSEYGYVGPEAENSESPDNKLEAVELNADCSLISSDVTDDLLEVEFTPDMTWRHKSKAVVS